MLALLQEAGLLFEWFVRKRGLAAGIAYSSGGIGGTIFPFLVQALYDKFSYRTSMIALVSFDGGWHIKLRTVAGYKLLGT